MLIPTAGLRRSSPYLTLFLLALLGPSWVYAQRFDSRTDLAVGGTPLGTAIADLDGDGRQDLVVTVHGAARFTVLRNTGSPGELSFAPRIDFPTGFHPQGLAIADFDNDGKPDVVTANSAGGGNISVYRNVSSPGDISLVDREDTFVNTAHRVATGDLDGDGKFDLAVSSNSGREIAIFRNVSTLGNIEFTRALDLDTASFPNWVAIGDIDGDGKPDVLAPIVDNDFLSIYRNETMGGSLSFAPRSDFSVGDIPDGLALGDLNGDIKTDVVVANRGSSSVSSFVNESTPGVLSLARHDFPAGSTPNDVTLSDLNRDGKLDVIVTNVDADQLTILRNGTTAAGVSLAITAQLESGLIPFMPSAGDLDNDGHIDVAASHHGAATAAIFRNLGMNAPTPGQVAGAVDPAYPIVVITHGWQPCDTFAGDPPPWVEDMENEITELVTQYCELDSAVGGFV